jgi:hypothetical protein
MMKNYAIIENEFGYLLTSISNNDEKIVLYRTKINIDCVQYYAKQVEPIEVFYSGMFFIKKRNLFTGKLMDGSRINIYFKNNTAYLEIK